MLVQIILTCLTMLTLHSNLENNNVSLKNMSYLLVLEIEN